MTTNFILDRTALFAALADKKLVPSRENALQFWDAAKANQVRQALLDLQAFIQVGNGAPAGSAEKGTLYVDLTNLVLYMNADGATAWQLVGAGGWLGAWAAGTFNKGSIVQRGPFLLGANVQNAIDPCFDFGNLGDNAVWAINGTGSSQTAGVLTLINNVNGQNTNGIYKSTVAGWDKRRLVADLRVQGTADGLEFGILDGAQPSNSVGTLGIEGMTGAWGVAIDIYDPGTPGYYSVVNGVKANRVADDNAAMTSAVSRFDRWYLDFVDNGVGAGTCTMTLYRNASPGVNVGGSSMSWVGFADDQVQLAQWTVTRPTFTNWRFVVGAHTGGSAGIFAAKHAYARYTGTEWSSLGLVPGRK